MIKIGFNGCFSRSYVSKITLLSSDGIYLLSQDYFSSVVVSSDLERDLLSAWSVFNLSGSLDVQVPFCILDPGQNNHRHSCKVRIRTDDRLGDKVLVICCH